MEFALPFFAFVIFALAAGTFALVVALAIVWIARRFKRSWLFSVGAGSAWLVGFTLLFSLSLLAVRWAAMATLEPMLNQHVPRDRVTGIYQARYDDQTAIGGVETLALKADGTYAQTYMRATGEVVTHSGRWQYEYSKEFGTSVSLTDALSPAEDTSRGKSVPRENFSTSVQSLFGRITLPLDPDLGYQYTKVM